MVSTIVLILILSLIYLSKYTAKKPVNDENLVYKTQAFSFNYPKKWNKITENVLSTGTEAVFSEISEDIVQTKLIVTSSSIFDQHFGREKTYKDYVSELTSQNVQIKSYDLDTLNGIYYIQEDNAGRSMVNVIAAKSPDSTKILSIIYVSNTSNIEEINSILEPILKSFKVSDNF